MTVSREMPKYQCHKQVWALKIQSISVGKSNEQFVLLHFEEDGYAPLPVSADWHFKHKPEVGGYYVVYEDGYKSYSPSAAFESGYSLIQAASTHQQRVLAEKAELDERREKLVAFFATPTFHGLPESEQIRMERQAVAMRAYSEILGERIAAF